MVKHMTLIPIQEIVYHVRSRIFDNFLIFEIRNYKETNSTKKNSIPFALHDLYFKT